ncbi:site-specific DNA-methyltransferase [Helicobacter pylori]
MQNKEISQEKSVNEKNLEVFNRYFPGCLSIENDNQLTLDVGRLKALLGDFSEIKEEGYGLDFVGKKIALNQAFKKNHKILKPLNESTSKHILIKGDNLDALKILKQSYSEKIKMIYIDPPYNTKNENFIYGDDFSQSNEEVLKTLDYSKEKLDYIKNLFGSKCHSGWLSFMYPRLLLARDLLQQDGVIFISIDDNEAAQLKLLCDEIFGEGNFVACCPVVSNRGGRDYGGIAITHEYILIYQKEFEEKSLNLLVETDKKFQYEDKNGFFNLMELRNRNIKFNSKNRPNLYYPFYVDLSKVDENNLYDISLENKKGFVEVYPLKSQGINTVWRWGKEKALKYLNLEIKAKKKQDGNFMIVQKYRSVLKRQRSIFDDVSFVTEKGSNAVKDLFNGVKVFDYPKSPFFIKRLIEISSSLEIGENENDIILDFFAGSGTTAHAVLESNKSDYQKLSEGGGGYLMA